MHISHHFEKVPNLLMLDGIFLLAIHNIDNAHYEWQQMIPWQKGSLSIKM